MNPGVKILAAGSPILRDLNPTFPYDKEFCNWEIKELILINLRSFWLFQLDVICSDTKFIVSYLLKWPISQGWDFNACYSRERVPFKENWLTLITTQTTLINNAGYMSINLDILKLKLYNMNMTSHRKIHFLHCRKF